MGQTAQALPVRRVAGFATYLSIVVAFFIGTFLVTLIFGTLLYQILYIDRFYPGVGAADVDLGGRTWDEGVALLRSHGRLLTRPLLLRYEGRVWQASPGEWGIRLDADKTAMRAWAVGRRGHLWRDLQEQLQVFMHGYNAEPILSLDEEAATLALGRLARENDEPARNARLELDVTQVGLNPTSALEAYPAQTGRAVDVPATLALLRRQVIVGGGTVDLVVRQVPPTIASFEPAREQLQNAISSPLVLTFAAAGEAERRWTLEPAVVANWISIEQVSAVPAPQGQAEEGSKAHLVVNVDPGKAKEFLAGLSNQINLEPRDARFDFDPRTGVLTVTQTSQEGRVLDVDEATRRVVVQLFTPQREVSLPVKVTRPKVPMEHPENLGIKELVSEATTVFKGSAAERVHNIQVAAAKFNGIVVPPGEIFSFGEHLGEVNAANGFEDSLIIWGDRTAVGLGGGICQVSTTAFRAAFWGGYEIVERWAHGYRVSWYEPPVGMDATVYTPQVDFKFRNDTATYLLIQTATDLQTGTVTFRFYGTKPNRTVEMKEPVETNVVLHGPPVYQEDPTLPKGTRKQVEWAKDGVDVTVERIVREGDIVIHQDAFFSRYKPWPAVYLVGTKKEE
jgi:vancomycin resistance protein YoaR